MDLRVVYIQDVLPVSLLDVTADDPPQVVLRGSDFNSAVEVFINRQSSPSFSVRSKTEIRAQIPDSQVDEAVQEVSVLSSKFTATDRSLIAMRLGDHPQHVSGLLRLIQAYIKVLMRNPGSDIFEPEIGAGLGNMIAKYLHGTQDVAPSDIALTVSRAERQVMRMQARDSGLSDDERLASAQLLGIHSSVATGSLVPRILLISQAGVSAVSQLEY